MWPSRWPFSPPRPLYHHRPAQEIGEAAISELRKMGVETDHVLRQGKRLGIYFAETGANQRPGKVTL